MLRIQRRRRDMSIANAYLTPLQPLRGGMTAANPPWARIVAEIGPVPVPLLRSLVHLDWRRL
jgi:hypothetical protein